MQQGVGESARQGRHDRTAGRTGTAAGRRPHWREYERDRRELTDHPMAKVVSRQTRAANASTAIRER